MALGDGLHGHLCSTHAGPADDAAYELHGARAVDLAGVEGFLLHARKDRDLAGYWGGFPPDVPGGSGDAAVPGVEDGLDREVRAFVEGGNAFHLRHQLSCCVPLLFAVGFVPSFLSAPSFPYG